MLAWLARVKCCCAHACINVHAHACTLVRVHTCALLVDRTRPSGVTTDGSAMTLIVRASRPDSIEPLHACTARGADSQQRRQCMRMRVTHVLTFCRLLTYTQAHKRIFVHVCTKVHTLHVHMSTYTRTHAHMHPCARRLCSTYAA